MSAPFKRIYLLGALAATLCMSCADNTEDYISPMSAHQREVIQYFKEVSLGFEYGNAPKTTFKWLSPMKIWVGGDKQNTFLLEELSKTIAELNALATDGFYIQLTDDTLQSNCYIFLGSKHEFLDRFPDAASTLNANYGLFNVWIHQHQIIKARIFVDTYQPTLNQQKSTLKEELTQALGFGKDSPHYANSIFYETPEDGGFALEYSDLDLEIISLLYHPDMKVGLTEGMVNLILIEIFRKQNHAA